MEEGKKALSVLAADLTETVHITEDFELPEYQPQVRKVLGIMHTVTRDSTFLEAGEGGTKAEIGGSVLYTLVYLGDEGQLTSVPLFSTYTTSLHFGPHLTVQNENMQILAEGDFVTCRVSAPRKLTLSAKVRVRCLLFGTCDCQCTVLSADEKSSPKPVLRWENAPCVRLKTHRHTGQLQGELKENPGAMPVTCRGHICIQNVQMGTDGTTLRAEGEGVIHLLLRVGEGEYRSVRSRVPLSETIPLSHPLRGGENGGAIAVGYPAAVTISGSEDGSIHWEMEYDLDISVTETAQAKFASDGYSLLYQENDTFLTTDILTEAPCIRGQLTVNGEKLIRRESEGGAIRFLFGWGKGTFEKAEPSGNDRMLLQGSAACTVLLESGGEIFSEEITMPIRYLWEGGMDGCDCRCSFPILEVNGHLEGNLLRLTAETAILGNAFVRRPQKWLQTLEENTSLPLPPARPAVSLYVPDPGESTWDIQKRFRTADITENDGRYIIRTAL